MNRIFYTICSLLAGLCLLPLTGFSQNANQYGFQAVSGTFTPVTGATSLSAIQSDDAISAATNIGFTFNYCGTNYTQFRISSNGFLTFNTSVSSSYLTNSQAELNSIKPALMWLWDDLSGAVGTASYVVTGTTPNRVLTIQMLNWRWNYSSSYAATISVQIKLYETTNIIEYVYRQEAGTGNTSGSSGATIGICDNLGTPTYLSLNNTSASPTASSTVFTTSLAARPATGQVYRFSPPTPCNSGTVFPATASTILDKDSICVGKSTSVSFVPGSAMPVVTGITYQLQSGPSATGPWANVGTPSAGTNFVVTPGTLTYYRIQVLCSGTPASLVSTPAGVFVESPTTPTASNISRCGPGNVTLTANTNATPIWYGSLSATTPLFTGNNITTFLSNSTTFYVAAGLPPTMENKVVGNGANQTSNQATPFYGLYGGYKHEYLVTQAELAAFGIYPGTEIRGWGVDIYSGSGSYAGLQISMGTTAATTLNTTFQTGATIVKNPQNVSVSVGENVFDFDVPYVYNGGNLLIQTCWSNNASSAPYSYVKQDGTSYNSTHYYYVDNITPAAMCGYASGGSTLTSRPKFIFKVMDRCESARVPVEVLIKEIPEVDLGADINTCVDEGHMEFLNARNSGSDYSWDNNYNGQVRVIDRSGTYWVTVTNPSGCASSDTINVTFKYNPVSELGNDTTLCLNTALTLDAGGNGIQYYWNTGATTRAITVNQGGQYFVIITAQNGCITQDSINVTQRGLRPTQDGIRIRNINPNTFNFSLYNPQNVGSVRWDFGDGSPYSYQMNPVHTYNTNGNYIVTITTYSSCGAGIDTTTVHIKGLGAADLALNNAINIYPNPASDFVTVAAENNSIIQQVHIADATGRTVEVINGDRSSTLKINTQKLAPGMYHLLIETSDGPARKKLDIIK